ncbi:MAG: hypothetical protein NVSMB9_29120 [Isosphaeraceae bacterium]
MEAFRLAIKLAPLEAIPRYNAAATLFQLGRFAEAQALYREARARAGDRLRTKIDYALGNTALALGDLRAAIRHYDDCVASTAPGADLVEVRRNALGNRKFAEEQNPSLPAPAAEEEDKTPIPKKSPGQGEPNAEPGPHSKGDGSIGPANSGTNSPPKGRGAGGAGGEGPTPPAPGSPQDQLSRAIENVRDSLSRRIDELPIEDDSPNRKDW